MPEGDGVVPDRAALGGGGGNLGRCLLTPGHWAGTAPSAYLIIRTSTRGVAWLWARTISRHSCAVRLAGGRWTRCNLSVPVSLLQPCAGTRRCWSWTIREMAKALRVVETCDGELVPNMAGLLLFGRQADIERYAPTHQAAFQVLAADADVRVNEFFRNPLLELAELFQARFDARVQEQEIQVGLIRVPVPDYARSAFREALLNALFHRDYRRLGTVYIQWHPDRLEFSSPGGFPEGVTPANHPGARAPAQECASVRSSQAYWAGGADGAWGG